jgi:conjugative transfer region protein (TIGR03750 family)
MILNDINYKMTIYRDCTLSEILTVGALCLILPLIVLCTIFKLFTGYGVFGAVIVIIFFWPIFKGMINKLQKIKSGKPHSYFKHVLIKKLIQLGLYNEIFIIKHQKWSVVRKKK